MYIVLEVTTCILYIYIRNNLEILTYCNSFVRTGVATYRMHINMHHEYHWACLSIVMWDVDLAAAMERYGEIPRHDCETLPLVTVTVRLPLYCSRTLVTLSLPNPLWKTWFTIQASSYRLTWSTCYIPLIGFPHSVLYQGERKTKPYSVFIARQHTDARYLYSKSVRHPSVCPLRSGIRWKRLNISS